MSKFWGENVLKVINNDPIEDQDQAGLSILFGRNLDVTISDKDFGSNTEGRMVWVKGELRSKIILFVWHLCSV